MTGVTLYLLAATAYGEARGESDDGVAGVCWVVLNRAQRRQQSVPAVVLAPGQFDCWLAYRLCLLAPFHDATAYARCERIARGTLEGWINDPTRGADHYLDVAVTLKARGGTLPAWAADPDDPSRVQLRAVTAVIGRHTFLRLDRLEVTA